MTRCVSLLGVALGATVASVVAQERAGRVSFPPPPGHQVVTVSKPDERGAEPALAIDPETPGRIVAAYGGPVVVWSADGGRSFTKAAGTAPEGWKGGGDVSLAYDDRGAAYLSYLTSDGLGTASYWAHNAGRSGIWVRRSPDGGRTWDKEPAAVKLWPSPDAPAPQMVDMSRIWSDSSPTSPYHGHLYVAWINWELERSLILFSRSTDQGRTWSAPMRISTSEGLPRDDNGGLVAPLGVVGPDGAQYVIWNDAQSIVFTVSTDGGRTFAPSRSIVSVAPPYFGGATGIPGIVRVMGFPQIALDWQRGTLYVTWSDFRNGDVDVFLASSTDRGRTWTRAERIVGDPIHDGKDQFFQWLAVDRVNGDVYVQFYDRRDDPANRRTGVTLLRSTDGAKTFTAYRWSEAPFEAENVFLGDYSWLVAHGGKVYGIWVEATPPDPAAAAPGVRPRNGSLVKIGMADFSRAK
ncbi:MAG: sialidase family protein [Vicinamibacterales bacterium]